MKAYLKYDFDAISKSLLRLLLDQEQVPFTLHPSGQLEILGQPNQTTLSHITKVLETHGIHFVVDKKNELVQRIRDCITEMIYDEEKVRKLKVSAYLTDKLGYSYTYLSTLFSEATYTSIENFVILKKIDYAKQLLAQGQWTLTEIAYKLNYSSVAHLSGQFKKTTGITPTQFQRILGKRAEHLKQH